MWWGGGALQAATIGRTCIELNCIALLLPAYRYGYKKVREWRKPLPLPQQLPNCPQLEWRNGTHDAACVRVEAEACAGKLRDDCSENLSAELLEFFERTLAYSDQQRWDTQQVMRCRLVARGRKLLQVLNEPATRPQLLEAVLDRMRKREANAGLELTVGAAALLSSSSSPSGASAVWDVGSWHVVEQYRNPEGNFHLGCSACYPCAIMWCRCASSGLFLLAVCCGGLLQLLHCSATLGVWLYGPGGGLVLFNLHA